MTITLTKSFYEARGGKERAATLARVSTRGQEDNSSLDGQFTSDRAYCDRKDYTIVAECREIISGAFVLARSDFNELLGMAADRLLDVIVVDVPDRLGRGDAIANLELLAKLNNARIEYTQVKHDTTTVEGLVQHSADQMVSGIERLSIKRRTTKGRLDWAKAGRVIAPPMRPYGYRIVSERDKRGRKVSCALAIVEEEARIAVLMYEWCALEGLTTGQIVRRLNEQGIPRMSDTDADYPQRKTIKRKGWARQTVLNILRNPLYRGQWQYRKRIETREDAPDKVVRTIHKREGAELSEIINVAVPRIVSDDLWEAAQEQLVENARKFMKPALNLYLLRGRLRCALCGGAMSGRIRKDGNSGRKYYKCNRAASDYARESCQCKSHMVRAEVIERCVWESIRDVMLHPDRLWVGIRAKRAEAQKARRLLEQSISVEQMKIDKVRTKEARLIELYIAGDIDQAAYRAKKLEYRDVIDKHENERQRLAARLGEYAVLTPEQEETLQHFQHEIASRMTDDVPDQDRMQLYDLLRVEVIYNSETGEVLISGLMGKLTVNVICVTSSVGRLAFSIVARIKPDGTFERLADNFFTVAARKQVTANLARMVTA